MSIEDCVIDPARPDQNGVPPKMEGIATETFVALKITKVAIINVKASDWLCSTVIVRGSFDAKDTWTNGIYENSRHFRFTIRPKSGRYYHDGDPITVELAQKCYRLPNFRKYTGPLDKILAKINKWLAEVNQEGLPCSR